jgi:hypothetical protein
MQYTPRSSSAPVRGTPPTARVAVGSAKSAVIARTSPIAPSAIIALARCTSGMNRIHIASMQNSFFCRATSTTARPSAAVVVNGFSHRTGLPADRHIRQSSWWRCSGVAM